jgi:hypothetical protein
VISPQPLPSDQSSRFADRLSLARRRRFVGREAGIEWYRMSEPLTLHFQIAILGIRGGTMKIQIEYCAE